jgi:hypothetical protein
VETVEERVARLERILFGLKVAAGVLGITSLGLLAFMVWAVTSINNTRSAAINEIRDAKRVAFSTAAKIIDTRGGKQDFECPRGRVVSCYTHSTGAGEKVCNTFISDDGTRCVFGGCTEPDPDPKIMWRTTVVCGGLGGVAP